VLHHLTVPVVALSLTQESNVPRLGQKTNNVIQMSKAADLQTSGTHVANERTTGAIRKLKEGYGFIAGDDGRDYFFHWSAMEMTSKNFRDLTVQERVEFSVVQFEQAGQIKYRAVQVRVLNPN
jgi:cold shock protein